MKEETKYEFKRGEWVEVLAADQEWVKRIYLTTIDNSYFPFIVVQNQDEKKFTTGRPFCIVGAKGIRKIQQPKEKPDCKKSQLTNDAIIKSFDSEIQIKDNINHPSHYISGKVECIDAIESATQGLEGIEAVCTGNAIKYLWRWKQKNGIEDLKKCRWYLDLLINKIENK